MSGIPFGLTGVANDESSTQRQIRDVFPHFLQSFTDPIDVGGAVHPAQSCRVSVLQRYIEVVCHLFMRGNHFNQLIGNITRVGIHHSNPIDTRRRGRQFFK